MTKKSPPQSPSVVGYLRVSTADQSLEKNKADILQLANHHDLGRVRFVEETVSGRISWRERKLADVLGSLQANDAIIVPGDFQIRLRRRKEKKRRSQPKVISGTSRGAVLTLSCSTLAATPIGRSQFIYEIGRELT